MAFRDVDGDGSIDVGDAAATMHRDLRRIIENHMSGYVITDEDALQDELRRYAGSIWGDLNADGVVDADDVARQVESASSNRDLQGVRSGDFNNDGVIDATDIDRMIEVYGQEVLSNEEALYFVKEAAALAPRAQISDLGPGTASHQAGDHIGPDEHNQTISATWPRVDPPMVPEIPEYPDWPADHEGAVSSTWEPDDGDEPDWPPNHAQSQSVTWIDHDSSSSDAWVPNHSSAVSGSWPTDIHSSLTSAHWPPNHTTDDSELNLDSMHREVVSGTWEHDAVTSHEHWPNNHVRSVSRTWDHQTDASANWPPSHLSFFSVNWPDPTKSWPPNHAAVTSTTWTDPPDHNSAVSYLERDVPQYPDLDLLPFDVLDEGVQ